MSEKIVSPLQDLDLKEISTDQYKVICDKVNNFNNLLWQIPAVSLTAQAFLMQIVLGEGGCLSRRIAAFLSVCSAIACSQLMAKHRYYEKAYTVLLSSIEIEKKILNIHKHIGSPNPYVALPSYWGWQILIMVFAGVAIAGNIVK